MWTADHFVRATEWGDVENLRCNYGPPNIEFINNLVAKLHYILRLSSINSRPLICTCKRKKARD